ncbi:transglutaminase domain-containing protein [Paenibacillus polymyxa]|uniref:transglutaminase domain-containing protein n=1 Tax=Paenibacillus polymyxa TaxID=1406 RepID=UPI0020256BA5|nr:transglutaminase domain-containing protein [Paenibacillus polymyxa]URJ59616.3 transglutaminase domain-containing protein [Paenibacillus polymyxa]
MNRKIGVRLVKCLVAGAALAVLLPQAVEWGSNVYATSVKPAPSVSSQQLQNKLLQAMATRSETLTFTYQGRVNGLKHQLQTAIQQAMESDPYVNYTIKSYAFTYTGTTTSAQVTIRLSYRETKEQTAYVDSTVKTVLGDIITKGMTDHEKVKAIHDWIVVRLKYDETQQKYTAYDGLKTGSTVCQGYSLLAYKMLERAGITNRIVEGRAGGQLHAWNLVLLDGRWYHMDTTWDDPTPDRANEVSTSYYLQTDTEMRRDHSWVKPYPQANTSYRETLSSLVSAGGSKAAVYQKLYNTLEYPLQDGKGLVKSSADIKEQVRKIANKGGTTLTFAYQGTERSLKEDLQSLYQLGLKSISYQITDLGSTGNLRVTLKWT